MTLSGYERETQINFNMAEDVAGLYTADPAWLRKLDRLCEESPELFREVEVNRCGGEIISKRYEFPKRLVSIRSKVRTMSDEQRERNAERLRRLRDAKADADTDSTL